MIFTKTFTQQIPSTMFRICQTSIYDQKSSQFLLVHLIKKTPVSWFHMEYWNSKSFAAIVLKTLFVSPNTKIASGISVERTSYWFYIPLWFHPNVSLQHLQKKIGFLKLNLQRISHSVHNHNFDLYELKYVQYLWCRKVNMTSANLIILWTRLLIYVSF
jgi:hypothetical protein